MLDKLYSIPNFGVILLAIIIVLIFLLLIVLFFGKKDEKKRKANEVSQISENLNKSELESRTNKEEENSTMNLFKETSSYTALEVPEVPLAETQEEIESLNNPNANTVLNEEILPNNTEFTLEEPKKENEQDENLQNTFDFDALAAEITKELETISADTQVKVEEEKPIIEEKVEAPILDSFKEVPEKLIEEPEKTSTVELKTEVQQEKVRQRTVMPTVFSSVYLNKKEESKEEPPVKVEEPKVNIPAPKNNIRPNIELPKPIDLPKLNREEPKVEPIIKEETSNLFPNMEEETYTIQK